MSRPVPVPMPPAPQPKPPKKTYPPEFKQNAVKFITELGRSHKDVAEQFKCPTQTVRYWVAKHNAQLEPTKRTETVHATEQLRAAQNETARLAKENDFLKNAVA